MYNRIIIVGNLTRDTELKYLQSGTAIANTGIASTKKFKSNGEQKQEVMFVDITFFGKTAEIANSYLHKGSKVLVEGRLKLDQWQDQSGAKRSKHSITVENLQMLDTKQNSQESYSNPPQNSNQGQSYTPPEIDIDDDTQDEIPF